MGDFVFAQPFVAGQSFEARNIVRFTGVSTATPSGTQNNYAPSGGSTAALVLLAPTAALTLTGLSISQANGRMVLLANTSSAEYITLVSGSVLSTAANRFALHSNHVIPPGTGVMLVYHGADSRWHLYADKPTSIVRVYTADDTWTPLPGLVAVTAICIGAGGGAGAGCCAAAGTVRCGGYPGAGGGWSERTLNASAIAGTKIIRVGVGGLGGTGVSTAGGGQDGQDGEDSEFDVMLRAEGGKLGRGGPNSGFGLAVAAAGKGTLSDGTPGVASSTTGSAGVAQTAANISRYGGGCGGPGGGITSGNAVSNGAAGTTSGTLGPIASAGSAGTAGGGGSNGGSGVPTQTTGDDDGGGASSITADAGDGGDGGDYGGGGGGGGASLTGRTAGDGGNGGDGLVIVAEHY